MIEMILFSGVAGIGGTGLGGLICAILMKHSTEKMACWMLSFAAGVMTSIVCFGLVPEAFALAGVFISVMGLVAGIVIIMALNRVVDKITETREEYLKVHNRPEKLYHESQFINEHSRIVRSGILILIAIGLHNIPEGIAIGAGGSHDFHLGFLLTVMIGLHNIPEGMAIATPLLAGGVNKGKVILLTALSGASTLLGGLIGILIGSISDIAISLSLSAAGGAMLYIVYAEMMPQYIVMTESRTVSLITLLGIIIGLIITQI
jgi:ZIP family zinc transporter